MWGRIRVLVLGSMRCNPEEYEESSNLEFLVIQWKFKLEKVKNCGKMR